MIYFDNAATTKTDLAVLESYKQVSELFWGNPSSLHRLGNQALLVLEKARKQIAQQLCVHSDTLYFTSGGTESNNWAIKGTALEKSSFGKHIITTNIEHPSVSNTMKQLALLGFEISYVEVDDSGRIVLEQLRDLLRKDTILVSVMAVNNEVGSVQPIAEMAALLEEYPWIHFHVDAVQAARKAASLLQLERIDLLSLSAHKFHGVRGVGILYKKFGRKLQPLLTGGGQEFGQRSTTENLPGIVSTAKALRLMAEKEDQTPVLRERLWQFLTTQRSVKIFSPIQGASHILCFAIQGVRGEVLVHALEEYEIFISTTSACSSKKQDSSSTLKAMNVPEHWAVSAVRVSFSADNTLEEVDELIRVLEILIQKFSFLRKG